MDKQLRKIKLFNDIAYSISLIDEFLESVDSFDRYIDDRKTKSAIERQFAIIGEAIVRLKKIDANELLLHQKKIIGFRNILVHGYDHLSDAIVWSLLNENLPILKADVIAKLETIDL